MMGPSRQINIAANVSNTSRINAHIRKMKVQNKEGLLEKMINEQRVFIRKILTQRNPLNSYRAILSRKSLYTRKGTMLGRLVSTKIDIKG